MKNMQNVTDFLENSGLTDEIEKVDLAILQKAGEYGVDLENLEFFEKKRNEQKNDLSKIIQDWTGLDVNLSDVLRLVVNTSERPSFMVRDDKLVYANPAAMNFLDADEKILGKNFLDFVVQDDWGLLTESIGEMITDGKKQKIRLKSLKKEVKSQEFSAVYLSEIDHFSFILLGEHLEKTSKNRRSNLFDELTGLPNFFLFEDRVQSAIIFEKNKNEYEAPSYMAVAAVNIENEDVFQKLNIYDNIMKLLAKKLEASVREIDTIAKGLKYTFWVFLPAVKNMQQMKMLLKSITDTLNLGVRDNFARHEIKYSMGVSIFPDTANSTKELMEQTIFATKKAQENPKKSIEIFRG